MKNAKMKTATVERALLHLFAGANGGKLPDCFDIDVAEAGSTILAYTPDDGRTKFLVVLGTDHRLDVTVGVPTSWTTLLHPGCRFARTPSGQLVILGREHGRRLHFWIDEDRVWCEFGSPLRSAGAEQEAMAAFDAELAALVAETL